MRVESHPSFREVAEQGANLVADGVAKLSHSVKKCACRHTQAGADRSMYRKGGVRA